MPIYEYRCNSCNHHFELRQKFSDPSADHCPLCDGSVSKVVSAVSFSLKGSGWFAEGYNTKADAATEDKMVAATGTATEAATEAAPKDTSASTAPPSPAATQLEKKNTESMAPAPGVEKAKQNEVPK